MFFRHKKECKPLDGPVAVAIVISVIALALAIGAARWSWLVLDEQVKIRREFVELKGREEQVNLQYEFWLNRLQAEREAGETQVGQ